MSFGRICLQHELRLCVLSSAWRINEDNRPNKREKAKKKKQCPVKN